MIVERMDMVACAQTWEDKCTKEKKRQTHTNNPRLLKTEDQLMATREEVGGEMREIDKRD